MPPNLVSREHLERCILLGSSFCFISFCCRASWNSDCVTRHLVLLRTLLYLFTCRLPERFASDFDFLAEAFGHKWLLSPSSMVACGARCVIPICAPTWFRRPPNKGSKVVPKSMLGFPENAGVSDTGGTLIAHFKVSNLPLQRMFQADNSACYELAGDLKAFMKGAMAMWPFAPNF